MSGNSRQDGCWASSDTCVDMYVGWRCALLLLSVNSHVFAETGGGRRICRPAGQPGQDRWGPVTHAVVLSLLKRTTLVLQVEFIAAAPSVRASQQVFFKQEIKAAVWPQAEFHMLRSHSKGWSGQGCVKRENLLKNTSDQVSNPPHLTCKPAKVRFKMHQQNAFFCVNSALMDLKSSEFKILCIYLLYDSLTQGTSVGQSWSPCGPAAHKKKSWDNV